MSATPEPQDPILIFEHIVLRFKGVTALDGVSFSVAPGELFAVIGPNGAGKTSIFNVLNGVYRPDSGRVRFRGVDITQMRPHRIAARGLARTFQNIELFPLLTVLDNLMLGRHHVMRGGVLTGSVYIGLSAREEAKNRRRVEEIIDFLEIAHIRKHPVAALPYGLQKRVELGRALAMDPYLLLLDEPAAGMNLEETEDMARFIMDVKHELGIAMVLVDHDMGFVMDLAERVMVLDFGVKIAEGTPAEVQRDPDVIRAYLGKEHGIIVDSAGGGG